MIERKTKRNTVYLNRYTGERERKRKKIVKWKLMGKRKEKTETFILFNFFLF